MTDRELILNCENVVMDYDGFKALERERRDGSVTLAFCWVHLKARDKTWVEALGRDGTPRR